MAFKVGDRVIVVNINGNVSKFAGRSGTVVDPKQFGSYDDPVLEVVDLGVGVGPIWIPKSNLMAYASTAAKPFSIGDRVRIKASGVPGVIVDPGQAGAGMPSHSLVKLDAYPISPYWFGDLMLEHEPAASMSTWRVGDMVRTPLGKLGIIDSFYTGTMGDDCAYISFPGAGGHRSGYTVASLSQLIPTATAGNPPASTGFYCHINKDDSIGASLSEDKPAAKNDSACPSCGDPRYSKAELDAKVPCWVCGTKPR